MSADDGARARRAAGEGRGGSGDGERAATGFGHGKVILAGEHAVVHGHAALAAGISAGIRVEARPGKGRLSVPAWSLEAAVGDGTPPGRALGALLETLGKSDGYNLDFVADAQIPSRAGLGSSAALAVAVARAAAAHLGLREPGDPDDASGPGAPGDGEARVQAAAAAAEAVFHGTPSGIDAAAAASGAAGRFRRGEGWRPVPVLQTITICVGLSGKPRDTAAQVAMVGKLRERLAAADDVLALCGTLAGEAEAALARGDVDGLGRIFDACHGLLCALRLSSPELDALVHAARAAGAVGAKLTGAGGGGAVIALAPAHERDVLRRWKEAGFDGFLADIRATGPEKRAPHPHPHSMPERGGAR